MLVGARHALLEAHKVGAVGDIRMTAIVSISSCYARRWIALQASYKRQTRR